MKFSTINPATEQIVAEYEIYTKESVMVALTDCHRAFLAWREVSLSERAKLMRSLAAVLRKNIDQYAAVITAEMGKPIRQSRDEVEKCAWTADVYAENAADWCEPEQISADGISHHVRFEPLGVILAIMPWNFPFWQAIRFGVPTLLVGNTSLLKHANNVPQCAFAIEEAFLSASFPPNIFKTILADHKTTGELIDDPLVTGVSFTGSTQAGRRIAARAGGALKKTVLELGGSDPFIVLDDANIDFAADSAVISRMQSTGQSCIAAKRFIVHRRVFDAFAAAFVARGEKLVLGDPTDERSDIGPLVNSTAVDEIASQVNDAIAKGATVLLGAERPETPGYFYKPTILTDTDICMRCRREELFGPVAVLIAFDDDAEAIAIANETEFGLGGAVFSADLARAERIAERIDSGMIFVNSMTRSDPRIPFGGTKNSGLGRELYKYGLREFVNIKSLSVYDHP